MNKLSHLNPLPIEKLLYGVCYYPEHWASDVRSGDAELLSEAGFNVVRMGEFAWHIWEPAEGAFSFDFFDREIERLGKKGIKTILCTPTACPPRWMSHDYPEIHRVDNKGVRQEHGSRQHASHFSTRFREFSQKITAAMAEHYRDNANVIGWQTDNEFHCHFAEDHSPDAVKAFQDFLKQRYNDDINQLNKSWGTVFWANWYDNFEEILTPKVERPTHSNPAHVLDYHRFLSDGVRRFQKEQIDILREKQPRWWITHNGCFQSIEYHGEFSEDLDFLSYDSYPFFDRNPANRGMSSAFNLDWTRSQAGNFIVMEQQAGAGGQTPYLLDTPEPGEMRRMAFASVAHGCDSLLFFRARTCRFGAEEYWCGILDHDNIPRRRFEEAAKFGKELKKLEPDLLGSSVRVDVAIAPGGLDANEGHGALHHGLPSPKKAAETVHNYFYKRQYAVGCVHPDDNLEAVKLYILPHLPIFDPKWLKNLEDWVQKGGTLVIGPRTACKDLNNNVVGETLPGCLRILVGATVEEFGRQNNTNARPLHYKIENASGLSDTWYEHLQPDDGTEVIAQWSNRFLEGKAAMTCRTVGRGRVIYSGIWLDPALLHHLENWLSKAKGLPERYSFPEGIEIAERVCQDGGRLRFIINQSGEAKKISFTEERTDLLTGRILTGDVTIEMNGVFVHR